nr:phage minor head protein [Streptomyces taklimakanensis]
MTAAETDLARLVDRILGEIAAEFARAVTRADDLTAASFSVSRIARMWGRRVSRITRRLLGITEQGAGQAADAAGVPLPDDWRNLRDRHNRPDLLPPAVAAYLDTTRTLLDGVGDRLAEQARTTLAEGLADGEDTEQLADRLRAVFAADGTQLGETRAERIARTEATRAWNAGAVGAARDLTGPDRPLVKQWTTRRDNRVRHAHDLVDGQLQLLDDPFQVAGHAMDYPGDPTAPPELTVNCRCIAVVERAPRTAASEPKGQTRGGVFETQADPAEHLDNERNSLPPGTAQEVTVTADAIDPEQPRRWHTPGDTALAFENQQTGDGRVFSPGALYWENGPWPLQYADEMLEGHRGAELAGAIEYISRDNDRIPGAGVLYPTQFAGASSIRLLEEGAPLGVSIDLDDVDIAVVARPEKLEEDDNEEEPVLLASLASASVLQHPDGHWTVHATNIVDLAASGDGPAVRASHTVQWTIGPDGSVHAPELHAALTAAGVETATELKAAAGDPDDTTGEVIHTENAGDFLMRITRARVRGATLVSMPAFARARIVLNNDTTASADAPAPGQRMRDVVIYVSTSPIPVSAADVAKALDMTVSQARDYLIRATAAGRLVRLSPGRYVGTSTLPEGEITASMSGDLDLPIHDDYDADWDGDAAASRVLDWATTGDTGDPDRLGAAFLYRDPDADPATLAAYKLGIADVYDGELHIVVRAVYAVANVLEGGRGGVDIPAGEQDTLRERVTALYDRIADHFDRDITPPWDREEADELEASAWQEMQALPPMPAAWFKEPTAEELPPGSGGVHYADGRIYGWVAQAGVPHEAYPGKNLTIESLGEIDTTAFLRTRFRLDDGTTVKVGAFTMNAGHHRDGAECETAACQFDDTRTVAGIVTVGINAGGMWFSGAAAPWLSEWDRAVFAACQPSYHMRQENGRWALRAVLSVPVPGHPSRLAASAVIDRANMALAASATPAPAPAEQPATGTDVKSLAAALAAELRTSGVLATVVGEEITRQQQARAEIERLAQQLAPARAEVAAGMAASIKGEN